MASSNNGKIQWCGTEMPIDELKFLVAAKTDSN